MQSQANNSSELKMARESKSAVPATPIKGGASRTTDRSAALIGERSVDFEDSDDDDDSQATDEDLGCGED